MLRSILILTSFLISIKLVHASAERDFRSKNGQVIRGTIVKYFEDRDVLLKRSKDLQLFRINLDIFTEDDQAFVKNNFPPNHDALPEFQRPLSSQALITNSRYIDNLIETRLRSYNQRPNRPVKPFSGVLTLKSKANRVTTRPSILSSRGSDKRTEQ